MVKLVIMELIFLYDEYIDTLFINMSDNPPRRNRRFPSRNRDEFIDRLRYADLNTKVSDILHMRDGKKDLNEKVVDVDRSQEGHESFEDSRHLLSRKGTTGIKKEKVDWDLDSVTEVDKRCKLLPTSGRVLRGPVGRGIAKLFIEVTKRFPLTRISPFNLNHAHLFFAPDKGLAFLFHAQDDQVKKIRQNIIKAAQLPTIKKDMKYKLRLPPPNKTVLRQILPNIRRPGAGGIERLQDIYIPGPAPGTAFRVDIGGEYCDKCSAPEDKEYYYEHRNIYYKNGKFKLLKGKPPYYTVAPEELSEHNWVADIVFSGIHPPAILYRPTLATSLAGMP